MVKSKLTSNGMINFPASLRKKYDLKPGDEMSFIETSEGILIVPLKKILEVPDSSKYDKTIEMIERIHKERREEK